MGVVADRTITHGRQGAKPGIGGHLPSTKIVGDVSRTRMIPEGSGILVGAAPVPPRKPSMAMISAPLRAIPLAMAAMSLVSYITPVRVVCMKIFTAMEKIPSYR